MLAGGYSRPRRAAMGQFFTPAPIASFMAELSEPSAKEIRFLDPGAGLGSLSAAWVARACAMEPGPSSIHLTAYDADSHLAGYLRHTVKDCGAACRTKGIAFQADVIEGDFIEAAGGNARGTSVVGNLAASLRLRNAESALSQTE